MLVTLGARNQTDELVDLLATCHRRIRQHIILARRLVLEGPNRPDAEVRDAASQIRRYFTNALPLHIADEDETIAPRLAGAGNPVAAAIAKVSADHASHRSLIDALVELCAEIEAEPARLRWINARLARLVEVLATELAAHLELEEHVVFPALRTLPSAERAAIVDAMRRRREPIAPVDERANPA